MRFTVIRNFSEVVDPEERKLRLRKIAQYAKRHGAHAHRLRSQKARVGKEIFDPSTPSSSGPSLAKKYTSLGKQSRPHFRRHYVAKDIVKKFQLSKGSPERKELSIAIKGTRRSYR